MADPATSAQRSAWWVRLLAALPWWVMNPLADLLAWLAWRVVRVEQRSLRENLSASYPTLTEPQLQRLMRDYYRNFSQVLVEVIRSVNLSEQELRERVTLEHFEPVRSLLAAGSPVLLVAAHQCNWEWMLLGLSLELGHPLEAAYKPLVDGWAQREMLKARSRFGARLVPAQELLAHILRGGRTPRAIAMVADQEPRTSERRHWLRFMNRDTAFFMGAEEITRVTKFPAFFIGLRRTRRGHYAMSATPLYQPGEKLNTGALTERYARLVEAQIEASPADWPWSHKRWKLKKSLYA
ncbi:MAG TPA: lysophospholipid acyltransferase family protein [Steroidobacteraceae bacterium]|nr:lysophospholipid acyltransferase family protein [Steroidobacteraceae bacterium]